VTLAVTRYGFDVPDDVRIPLTDDNVALRLVQKDATLWGPDAETEASIRLGWLDLPATSRALVRRLTDLRAELVAENLDRVVLCGMGGSSLAPEVICRAGGVSLTVVDTTDAGQIAAALADLDRTVVVVSSKSGATVETDSHRRAFLTAFAAAGLDEKEIGSRFVVVTDPGSSLAEAATAMGARAVFQADPTVGGRYSALSAFGLVPSALAGADIGALLEDAEALAEHLAAADNPAMELGVALGAAFRGGRDKLALADGDTALQGFGHWAEQLIAESTGKQGRGILPVVLESAQAPGGLTDDVLLAVVGGDAPGPGASIGVTGPLGAQFLAWEYATVVACRILGVNPFDQPDVTESKANTTAALDGGLRPERPPATLGAIEVHGSGGILDGVDLRSGDALTQALEALLAAIPPRGYLAVLAFLDSDDDAAAGALRAALAARTEHPVTFGWGPRYLHSTGQYHKGGPQVGVFLQLTGVVEDDLPVPGRPYTFATLQEAQAAGDRTALADRQRPVLHLHLTDRAAGLEQLRKALT
jgi:hypothetical protein